MLPKRRKNSLFTLWELNGFSFKQIESPTPKDALWQVWLKLVQWFSRRRYFLISSMYFRYFVIISPLEKGWALFEQTWILFTQECFVPNLDETGTVILEKKIFLNFVNVFLLFHNYLPWKKAFEQIWVPLHPGMHALCQVWMKLTKWFWKRKFFFKFRQCIFAFL